MKRFAFFALLALELFAAQALGQPGAAAKPALKLDKSKWTFTAIQKWVSRKDDDWKKTGGHRAFFHDRKVLSAHPINRFVKLAKVPATTLPVDCTGGQTVVCPMNGNDTYGDCGEAMVTHADNIFTFGQGKSPWTQSQFNVNALVNQYLTVSGGDNGMDEQMLVGTGASGGIWNDSPGLAPAEGGNPGPTGSWQPPAPNNLPMVVDALDFDVTNVPLTQYLIDQFYTVEMAWSVPDSFLDNFTPGATYNSPVTPDPRNGHYTPLTDVAANGNYTLYTWGAYCFVTPGFVAQVQPQCFVVFNTRQFNPATGYDSHGRHITTQAAAWQAMGGNAIPQTVISAFPGVTPATPAPVISGPATATATVGTAFSAQVTASNSPTSYGATGLPPGLTITVGGGLIAGTPTTAGTYSATVTATNAGGTGQATVSFTVSAPPTPGPNPAPTLISTVNITSAQGPVVVQVFSDSSVTITAPNLTQIPAADVQALQDILNRLGAAGKVEIKGRKIEMPPVPKKSTQADAPLPKVTNAEPMPDLRKQLAAAESSNEALDAEIRSLKKTVVELTARLSAATDTIERQNKIIAATKE